MLSSFGFDSKGTGRNNRTGPSRFLPDMMSRGLSVHVFKHSAGSAQPPQPLAAPKYDPPQARLPTSGGGLWNRQMSYQASRSDAERKQPPVPLSQDRRLVQVPQPATQPWPVDTKYGKSHSKGFLIHPSLDSDMFIYEPSILSVDDVLSSSPSSDTSSDSDLMFAETAMANLEISSTRARSSTETLESTLFTNLSGRHAITGNNAVPSLSRPPLAITAPPPRPASTRPPEPNAARPVIPLTRADSQRARTTSISHVVHPIQFTGLDATSDSDSDTVVSETQVDNMVVDMLGTSHWSMHAGMSQAARSATPFRRDSDPRIPSSAQRRDAPDGARDVRDAAALQGSMEDASHPRAPPGLYGAVATPPDAKYSAAGQSPPRGSATTTASSSPTHPSGANISPGTSSASRAQQMQTQSSGSPPQPSRTSSARPPAPPSEAPVRNEALTGGPSTSPPTSTPPRKNSQSSSPQGSPPHTGEALVAVTSKRTVRWTEELVCPSPVPPENRRKGWFNRRGDQLWTNDGQFRMPEPGQEYPPDLAHYPEPNTGWMNEEGVRIDMQHRLVPKRPLRSALKQPKSTV
ncbi:hypothetical protein BV20DRAFT_1003016 [Pilatotrama ljubarskyi]|nr:hypothetical protein BV20DRAFT_1003016 [Pilatotrama ljubarskyi]